MGESDSRSELRALTPMLAGQSDSRSKLRGHTRKLGDASFINALKMDSQKTLDFSNIPVDARRKLQGCNQI